jgi:hypothetical protein
VEAVKSIGIIKYETAYTIEVTEKIGVPSYFLYLFKSYMGVAPTALK